jgi:hypothetical protein
MLLVSDATKPLHTAVTHMALSLFRRKPDDETIEALGQLDLAGKAAMLALFLRKFDDYAFHFAWATDDIGPLRRNIDLASRARARATTYSQYSRHVIQLRSLHKRHPGLRQHLAGRAGVRNKCDGNHALFAGMLERT